MARRSSIVQGPRQSCRNAYSGVCRLFAVRVLHGRAPVVDEDGGQLRDFVSVHDVARANLLVLQEPRADYQAFNVGAGRALSVLDYAWLVIRALGREGALVPEVSGAYRFGDTRHIMSDVGRLGALGWAPRTDWAAMGQAYAAWAERQPDFRDVSDAALAHLRAVGTLRGGLVAAGSV